MIQHIVACRPLQRASGMLSEPGRFGLAEYAETPSSSLSRLQHKLTHFLACLSVGSHYGTNGVVPNSAAYQPRARVEMNGRLRNGDAHLHVIVTTTARSIPAVRAIGCG